MWWNQTPPWMQGMGQGQGQALTPGAGMPPYGRAPMNMNPVQIGPPGSIPAAPPPQAQQTQQPMNPSQMGMLSQMLAQQTGRPMPAAGIDMGQSAAQGVGSTAPPTPLGAVGQTSAAGHDVVMGLLQRMGLFGPR